MYSESLEVSQKSDKGQMQQQMLWEVIIQERVKNAVNISLPRKISDLDDMFFLIIQHVYKEILELFYMMYAVFIEN